MLQHPVLWPRYSLLIFFFFFSGIIFRSLKVIFLIYSLWIIPSFKGTFEKPFRYFPDIVYCQYIPCYYTFSTLLNQPGNLLGRRWAWILWTSALIQILAFALSQLQKSNCWKPQIIYWRCQMLELSILSSVSCLGYQVPSMLQTTHLLHD